MGFSNFKIEGRGLGSALILEFLLYYMTKPEYQLRVREEIYLNNMLDLFWMGKRRNRFIQYLRQYRIILSADTASEVRQMLSQKRR